MKTIDVLKEEFEESDSPEEFGMENIQMLFDHIRYLQGDIEWARNKPRREDAIKIRELRKQLDNQKTEAILASRVHQNELARR